MNILIAILLVLAGIIVLLLVIALFIKKEYTIEQEIIINRPKQEVFNYIKLLKNQDYYSKWVMTDPGMKKDFKGTDGTVGFVYAWNGNKQAGEGEQEITKLIDGDSIDIEVRFIRPFKAIAKTPFITEAVPGNQTKVKWGMTGKSPYPLNFMNLFIPNMLSKDLATSLNNLKNILEK
jgi:Polyketide cyclase / dehydrase and lipid transport